MTGGAPRKILALKYRRVDANDDWYTCSLVQKTEEEVRSGRAPQGTIWIAIALVREAHVVLWLFSRLDVEADQQTALLVHVGDVRL